jgi:hypothetical protein
MAWVEEKTREGGILECLRRGRRGSGRWVRWRGRWDPTGARGAASLRTTHTHRHARIVREGGMDRPSVVDRNFSPFFKFQT